MQSTVVIIVAIYMLGMLWIGFWSSKMISSSTDFMVADDEWAYPYGRNIGCY